jgi:hypothetical protein
MDGPSMPAAPPVRRRMRSAGVQVQQTKVRALLRGHVCCRVHVCVCCTAGLAAASGWCMPLPGVPQGFQPLDEICSLSTQQLFIDTS